jgi:hypothetical protein
MAAAAMASTAGAHDCQCRYFGQSYAQGEIVCMHGKLAQCGMYLNNSSGRVWATYAPQAGAPDPQSRQLAISPSPIVR